MKERIISFLKHHWWTIPLAAVFVLFTINQLNMYNNQRRMRERMENARVIGSNTPSFNVQNLIPSEIGPEPATSAIMPAPNTTPSNAGTIPKEWMYRIPSMPVMDGDVLAKLDMTLKNEFTDPYPIVISDEVLRGAADYAYRVLQTYDERIRSWTLHVRPADNVAETFFIEDQKSIIIRIDVRNIPYSLTHEMAHALLGLATDQAILPGFVNEFIAIAAEFNEPRGVLDFDYDRLNRGVLGMSRSLSLIEGKIGNDSPLDMERYTLLRLAGKKIGKERFHALAARLAKDALASDRKLTMADVQPIFEEFGIGDCVLFTRTPGPGIYVDVAFTLDGTPYIMYKQVDGQGVETSINNANIRVTLKRNGEVVYNFPLGSTAPNAIFTDPAGMAIFPYADEYNVTIGMHTYVWKVDADVGNDGAVPKHKNSLIMHTL